MNASRSTLDARGRFSGSSVASLVNVTIRAALLPPKVVEFLQSQANTIANLLVERDASREEDARIEGVPNASEGNVHVVGPKEFWGKLVELFKQAGGEWQDVADSIWAFGPKRVGPNMLIDRTQQKRRRYVCRLTSWLVADLQYHFLVCGLNQNSSFKRERKARPRRKSQNWLNRLQIPPSKTPLQMVKPRPKITAARCSACCGTLTATLRRDFSWPISKGRCAPSRWWVWRTL